MEGSGNDRRTDDELYGAFLSGRSDCYDALMLRYGDAVTAYLHGFLDNWQDAEDLMIEAFARIMVKRPSVRDGCFKAYLYRTARNLAARFHDRSSRTKVFSLEELGEEAPDTRLPEDELFRRERKETLYTCMDRLEPDLKEALWLFYFEGLSYAQAAQVMGVMKKRFDHLLDRAKRRLREELGKGGITDANG